MAHPSRGSLVGPWAAAGICGGWLYVEAFGILGDSERPPFALLLSLMTPIVAGLFGWVLTIHARKFFRGFSPALAFGATLVAGLANGILIGGIGGAVAEFPAGFLWGVIGGGIFGVICAVPFLVPLTLSARLLRSYGRARPGTLVDRSDRRMAWVALAPCAAIAAFLVEASSSTWHPPSPILMVIAIGAAAVALAFAFLEIRAWRRAAVERGRHDDGASPVFDVGVGDDTVVRIERARDAYRDADREIRVPRGSPVLAEAALARHATGGTIAAAITLVAVYATAMTHATRNAPPTMVDVPTSTSMAAPPPALRVKYSRADDARRIELLGVKAYDHTAYVLSEKDGATRVRAIDYQSDLEIASFEPTRDDPTQWLSIARSMDVTTVHPSGLPVVDSAGQTWAFTDSSSRLHLTYDGRSRPISIGPARDAMFAPSGDLVAFVAGRKLQIADASKAKPAMPVDLIDPGAPLVTAPDRIFVVAAGTKGDCVYQVDPSHPEPKAPIFCPQLEDLVMIGNPSRTSAAVCGTHTGSTQCTWLELPSGAIKGRVRLDRRVEPLTLGPEGLLVGRAGEATMYVSLKDQGKFREDIDPDCEIDARAGRWIDETGTLVALRRSTNEWDVVEIDVDRMIDGAAR